MEVPASSIPYVPLVPPLPSLLAWRTFYASSRHTYHFPSLPAYITRSLHSSQLPSQNHIRHKFRTSTELNRRITKYIPLLHPLHHLLSLSHPPRVVSQKKTRHAAIRPINPPLAISSPISSPHLIPTLSTLPSQKPPRANCHAYVYITPNTVSPHLIPPPFLSSQY